MEEEENGKREGRERDGEGKGEGGRGGANILNILAWNLQCLAHVYSFAVVASTRSLSVALLKSLIKTQAHQ